MSNYQHGKVRFRWCDTCGTLVLGEVCGICGRPGREFEVSAPGDIRPCFGKGVDTVAELFQRHFGTSGLLRTRNVFLNKVAGEDRADEVVLDGRVVAVIRFELVRDDFVLELKAEGAALLAKAARKGVIRARRPPGHLKGKKLDGADVLEVLGDLKAGDPVVVVMGNTVAAGEARVGSDHMKEGEKVVHLRDVCKADVPFPLVPADWNDFVKANQKHLRQLEAAAISDLRSFAHNSALPISLSFSGGKDSLACYGLTKKALGRFDLLFIDTGLEFPETVQYVRSFARSRGERLRVAKAGNAFWENVGAFGPPAKDFRWCCKVCKLGPLTALIEENYRQGTVTVEGNRALESFARSRIGFVERNPFVPNQTVLNPIRDWRAAEVWGYIWMEGLEYNPLYEQDLERIGCYLCASCLGSEWRAVRQLHPDLYSEWERWLGEWGERVGVSPDFVRYGFWRWKALPPKMRLVADELHMKVPQMRNDSMELRISKGASPCVAGGFSMEGVLTIPRKRDFSQVAEALKTVGKVKFSPEFEVVMVKTKGGTLKMFGGGHISAIAPTKEEAERLFRAGAEAFLRGQLCTSCRICERNCRFKAITADGQLKVDERQCQQCGECAKACVVAHYYDKLVQAGDGKPVYAGVK
ncbi:MAG: phosphoadenosine phosphosulfate reductase family protein [Euryarchaeota archaeon]|jgi:phosphoadenosine phosphosulfate reductase|nr:phosphoadenosine phosphosulfate reductase family protein [Euryarchaeota archaeon]